MNWSVKEVAAAVSLNERTIRSYLYRGIIKATKKDGRYTFSAEEFEKLLSNPYIKPAIEAKRRGVLLDFLGQNEEGECLMIRKKQSDNKNIDALSKAVCDVANNTSQAKMTFFYDDKTKIANCYFVGNSEAVAKINQLFSH